MLPVKVYTASGLRLIATFKGNGNDSHQSRAAQTLMLTSLVAEKFLIDFFVSLVSIEENERKESCQYN